MRCNGTLIDTFSGKLTPKVNEENGRLEFGVGSGSLKDREGHELTFTGEIKIELEGGGGIGVE
jgi:hypothetical protein